MSSVPVGAVFAKLRHFKLLAIHAHEHHAKLRSHRDGFLEAALHDLRRCICGDIPVFRLRPKQGVPHTPARKKRSMTRGLEGLDNLNRRIRRLYVQHRLLTVVEISKSSILR